MTELSELKARISEATTLAMKARDKPRVATLRMVNAELKRVEVDERRELSDADVLAILNKMLKQRQDSLTQFRDAGRDDLADIEASEIALISEFMPQPLSDEEVEKLVADAVASSGAASMKDMGQVMALLRPDVQGRADMGRVSALVKAALG